MKNTTKTITKSLAAALVLSSATSFAGEPVMMPMEPAPAPSLWSWFAGGSVGYLTDAEEEFYSVHLGAEKHVGETSHALYLEVGYFEFSESGIFEDIASTDGPIGYDLDVDFIPVTLNYKFERPLFNNVNYYLGAGAGAMFIDGDSDDDTVFTAQASFGLVWNVSERFEIFGGGRWLYLDEVEFSNRVEYGEGQFFDAKSDSSDDWLAEIGLRFNF
jgi:hypothetical protein